jgi:ferrous iron transport protein B
LILYFFISILEDSGYFARTALLADPLFRRFGLHGKSFIPMLMGFGCSVPAVMATRTIDSRKNRLITMMTLPFMSCSARLPVYTILAGAFFPDYAAWVMLALYAGGILMALGAAWVLNLVFHRNEEGYFVMEMPPYRLPVARGILKHTWEKGRQYLQKMGGIILIASIVVWALGYFPQSDKDLTPALQQEQSYLGQVGRAITPVLEPLGYDWHLGVGIIAGVGAKELMVSSIGVLYNVPVDEGGEAEKHSLAEGLKRSGTTPAAALSYLVFALLYFPCLATLAAIKGESGHWKYALFTAGYTTTIAYAMAFIVYRIALLFL